MSSEEPSVISSSTTLREILPGQTGRIVGFNLPVERMHRLLEMGFTVGTLLRVVRYAPLGDPMELEVRGYHISLRRTDAAGVLVDRVL